MKPTLNFQVIETPSEVDRMVNDLFNHAHDAPVFYSSGMIQVWRSFTTNSMVIAVLLKHEKPLIALPLFKQNQWQNIALDGWDNLDALRIKTCSEDEERLFWQNIVKYFGGLKLTEFTQNSSLRKGVQGVKFLAISRRKCPYILLQTTWHQQHEMLSKKLVRNLRQYGNKAKAAGIVFSVKKASDLNELEKKEKLHIAFSFHEKRMEEINQSSKFTPAQWAEYHLLVLKNAENAFVIEAQNEQKETIAFYYGLLNKHRLAWFNGGYSPEYVRFSIGTLLVSELISYAMENGQRVFDFLRGNESYKQKWTSDFDLNEDIYLFKSTLWQKLRWSFLAFNHTRKRMGSKRAFQKVMDSTKNGKE